MKKSPRCSYNEICGETVYRLPDGIIHREDGPAISYSNGAYQEWQVHGKTHRLDGPAIIGRTLKEWWINDYHADRVIKPWAKEMNIDLDNLSEEDKILIAMVWGDYDGSN